MNTVLQTKIRRGRLETISTILTVSSNGIKKTHIMYRANLSHQQLEKFLELLISKGLLMKDGDSYNTTRKGQDFLEEFEKVQSFLGENNNKSNISQYVIKLT